MTDTSALDVPKGWTLVPVGDLLAFKNGLNKGKAFFGYGTPIVNYMDVFGHAGLYKSDVMGLVDVTNAEKKAYSARKGDVFFTRTSETPEEVGISSVIMDEIDDAVFSGFVLRGRPVSQRLNAQFAQYCFSSSAVRSQIISSATYTTRALTNGKTLSKVLLPLPNDPSEQEAIAEALSDADALIKGLERLIAKKRRIKQGAMQDLLTAKRRLPGFSGEWVERKLGEVARIATGSRNNQDKDPMGDFPFFVRSDHVERIRSWSYDCEAILVPGEGRIGEIFHYVNGKFDVHQRVYCISDFSEDVSGRFIYTVLRQFFGKHAMTNTVKATVDSLRRPTFTAFSFLCPQSQEEQHAIADVLADMDAEIQALEAHLVKARQVKEGMMQNLLTGRIRLV